MNILMPQQSSLSVGALGQRSYFVIPVIPFQQNKKHVKKLHRVRMENDAVLHLRDARATAGHADVYLLRSSLTWRLDK